MICCCLATFLVSHSPVDAIRPSCPWIVICCCLATFLVSHSPVDAIRPSCHLSCDLLNELLHFDLIVDCLSCHFGQWMKAARTRSDLSCPLSNEVRLCSLVICTHHTLSNIRVFLYSYYSNYVSTMCIGFLCTIDPPLCMITALTVAIMQYTVCNRPFYRMSKVSLLCQPFRRCGQVALFLY